MESIADKLKMNQDMLARVAQIKATILANPKIQTFVQENALTDAEIDVNLNTFQSYLTEYAKFQAGGQNEAKGYEPVLAFDEGQVSYELRETAELVQAREAQATRNRVKLEGVPASLKDLTWSGIEKTPERVEILAALANFVNNYQPRSKGIYLYGSMGVGKSYMMVAMLNELSKRKAVGSTLVHWPTYAQEINYDNVDDRIARLKATPVLVMDDIGAESISGWLRDSVIQIILQHRMDNLMPTFFTSNLDFATLEQFYSLNGKEPWPAKRVMERVKALGMPIQLKGRNHRNDY